MLFQNTKSENLRNARLLLNMFYTQEQMMNTSCLSGQSGPVTEIRFFKGSTSYCAVQNAPNYSPCENKRFQLR